MRVYACTSPGASCVAQRDSRRASRRASPRRSSHRATCPCCAPDCSPRDTAPPSSSPPTSAASTDKRHTSRRSRRARRSDLSLRRASFPTRAGACMACAHAPRWPLACVASHTMSREPRARAHTRKHTRKHEHKHRHARTHARAHTHACARAHTQKHKYLRVLQHDEPRPALRSRGVAGRGEPAPLEHASRVVCGPGEEPGGGRQPSLTGEGCRCNLTQEAATNCTRG